MNPRFQANGILPCATCPWRIDQDAAAVQRVIPPLKAENLLRMVGKQDGFREIMQCHGTRDAEPSICNGYLAREGPRNIYVRILLATGDIATVPDEVLRECRRRGIKLHRTFKGVLAKLWS